MSNEATVPGIGVCECESCRQEKKCEHPVDALVLKWMDHGEKRVLCSCGYDFGPVRELIEKAAKADFVLAYKATLDNAETPSVFHTLFESKLREENQKLQKEFGTYRESHGITNDRAKALEDERNTSQNKRKMAEGQVLMLRAEIDNVRKERDEAHVEAQEAHSRADIYLGLVKQKQAEIDRLSALPCGIVMNHLKQAEKERDEARNERDELKASFARSPCVHRQLMDEAYDAIGFKGEVHQFIEHIKSLREKSERLDDVIAITRQVKP